MGRTPSFIFVVCSSILKDYAHRSCFVVFCGGGVPADLFISFKIT